MKPVRIVLTCNYSPWSFYTGGAQRSTHNLARALAERGHDVTVVFTKAPHERIAPPKLPYKIKWAALLDYKSRREAPLRPLTAFTIATEIKRQAASGGPFVVHAQGEEGALLPVLRKHYPFGLVVTPRFPSLPEVLTQPGGASLLQKARLGLWDAKYLTMGAALRGADYCSPPSFFAGDLMRRAYGLREAQIRPVHNGIPHEFIKYRWTPGDGTRPVLFFGRLSFSKGVDTILEALTLLGDRAPDLVMVGRGPEKAFIEKEIAAKKLKGKVSLRDWASHDELGRLLTRASVSLIPSREENFSLAVLACMAVGTPLITTPVGGTPEVLTHEENGLLVEAGDAAGLAEALRRYRNDPGFAAKMGAAASQKTRAHFTWQETARKFEALYETIL